ncbi:MAG: phosphatidate cytidylyltransferase, partial [Candidatus Binatia bacterium]
MEANLKRRILTALLIVPFLAVVVGWGPPWIFAMLILGVTSLALFEYFNIALPAHPADRKLGVLFGLAVSLLAVIPEVIDRGLCLSVLLVLIFTVYVFVSGKLHDKVVRLGWLLLGGFYIGLLMPNWVFLFRLPNGRSWVFFVFAVIVMGDTVAYFIGRRFGVKKLAPEISPGKTWVGAWAYTL